ncbi:MAG: LPS-assembly protein LptD, partial [Inquilinus sp.]|nr:LPS-assembly protein LptD [Inquilinus sp.]
MGDRMRRCGLGLTVLAVVGLAVAGASAQPADAQPANIDQPIVFSADEVVVDDVLNLVIARGNVEIAQAGRVLTADTVTYNPRSQVVAAAGNIVLVEPSGEVIFADYAELDSTLAEGFIENIGVLFTDDSRLAADRGVRHEGRTEVGRAVYSPCALCEDDPEKSPLWQLRAGRVIHDTEEQQITYRDAFLDLYGVPILYTPYFSHPDPSVDRQSGFLAPRFGSTSDLGPFGRLFYYWNMAPNQDATIETGLTRDAGPLLGLEYRHRFEAGQFIFDGSVNRSDRTDFDAMAGATVIPDQVRGHVFADGEMHLTEHWRTGISFNQASDDTYLDQFEISGDDVLNSRAYAEGFYGLDYASAQVLRFQDLRPNTIDQPAVLPWLTYSHAGEPGSVLGGRWFAGASGLSLYR